MSYWALLVTADGAMRLVLWVPTEPVIAREVAVACRRSARPYEVLPVEAPAPGDVPYRTRRYELCDELHSPAMQGQRIYVYLERL